MPRATPKILLARFEVTPEYLRESLVSTLDFPYTEAFTELISTLESQFREGKELEYEELPPYKSLNTVLCAWCPTLSYAFEKQRGREARQMLALGHDAKRRPTGEQLGEIVYEWAREWMDRRFPYLSKTTAGKGVRSKFLDQLPNPRTPWREVDASALLDDIAQDTPRFNNLGFRAIPALMASFVAGTSSLINGKQRNWWLCREDDGNVIIVSDPYVSAYTNKYGEDKMGTFTYKLEFRLQTQVGRRYPWLHVYVRCRRYVDEPLLDANFGRSISAMIGIGSTPLFAEEDLPPTYVIAPIWGGVEKARWDNDPSKLLTAMQMQSLIEPSDLLADPAKYREESAESNFNAYYLINAEGYDPDHEVKTGFSFKERSEVIAGVAGHLGLDPSKGTALDPDDAIRFTRLEKPLAMFTARDIADKKFVRKSREMTDDEHERQNQLARQKFAHEALCRATDNRPVQIFILWHTQDSYDMVLSRLRELLFLGPDDPWPSGIQFVDNLDETHVGNDLIQPLDSGQMNPQDRFIKGRATEVRKQWERDWDKQMRLALRRKTQAWTDYLTKLVECYPCQDCIRLAIVELPEIRRPYHASQSIYSAIKCACNQVGIVSQGLRSVKLRQADPADTEGQKKYKVRKNREIQSTANNALLDLIMRSPGAYYGQLHEIYAHAGLDEKTAKNLRVVGIANLDRNNGQVNYPVAVELCANGQVRARLPGSNQSWIHPCDAAIALGQVFLDGDYKLGKPESAEFVAQILSENSSQPTLALLDAVPWRNYNLLPQFSNRSGESLKNVLDLKGVINFGEVYAPEQLPTLRIIRLRRPGTSGETPQYVATLDQDWDEIDEATDLGNLTGYVDTQADSVFFHYLSVGQKPVGAKNQKDDVYKDDEGGGIAFKHQTIVEFVPFFLQKDDSDLVWCRIPHLLRLSPAWDGGNTVMPYPMHLAYKLLTDQLGLIGDEEDAVGEEQ